MDEIVPRWEFRTFAPRFGAAEERIRSIPARRVRLSDEVYILSRWSVDNTKVRGGVLDIKTLRRVDANGLEQWMPLLKAAFPISGRDLTRVFAAWKLDPGEALRREHALDALLEEIVRPHPDLAAVEVHKERHGRTIDGCTAEIAELRLDGRPIRTIAVESEDPVVLLATVRRIGLDAFENISYVTALKRFVGWGGSLATDVE